MKKLYSHLVVLFVVLSGSSVFSLTLEQIPKTSVLDISALFQKSNEILPFNPKTSQIQDQENSSMTVNLYPRDTLSPSPFKNYRDLTLARLNRDAARVNLISKKLNLGNEGNESTLSPMDVEVAVISGKPQGSYEYFARLGIGTPAKEFYLTLDTGTDITWIQCLPCTGGCYTETDHLFDPLKSSSYKPCQKPIRGPSYYSCIPRNCDYRVEYGDHSLSEGNLATETFEVGSSVINDVAIGCGRHNKGNFAGSAGILGLGRGSSRICSLSFPSQIQANSFSYCLVDRDSISASKLSFGASIPSDSITTPFNSLLRPYYIVSVTGISVGRKLFPVSGMREYSDGVLAVDSGTFLTMLPTHVYNMIRDEFVKGVKLPLARGFNNLDTCFVRASGARISVPTIAFHFGDKILVLPTKNYLLVEPENQNTACFAFNATTNSFAILGNFQQQSMQVTFDLGNSLVGFSTNKC